MTGLEPFIWFVLKVTVFFVAVYWIVHTVLDKYLGFSLKRIQMQMQSGHVPPDTEMRNLKLQAYERLMLWCDRVSIPKLIRRIKTPGMTAGDLKTALFVALEQEYNHNITQQIYVSEKLWEIIELTRNQTLNIITSTAEAVGTGASSDQLEEALYDMLSELGKDPVKTARIAIAKESKLTLG